MTSNNQNQGPEKDPNIEINDEKSSAINENFSTDSQQSVPSRTQSVKEAGSNFNLLKEVWEWFYTIIIALLIVLVLKGYIFDIVRVDGPSMNPTLVHNDRLLITKFNYSPSVGDIIILDSNYTDRQEYYEENEQNLNWFTEKIEYLKLPTELKHRYYVKRIIGMPGDTVDIKNGKVFVNGGELDEPYIKGYTPVTDPTVSYPVTVKKGHVFVMGDNRQNSTDSRTSSLGQVPFEAIIGKSQFRIWPFDAMGKTE